MKYLSVLLIALFACGSSGKDFTGELKNCVAAGDLEALNQSCVIFEEVLAAQYPAEEIESAYLHFVRDYAAMELHPIFFIQQSALDQLAELKSSGTFFRIWYSYAEAQKEMMEGEQIVVFGGSSAPPEMNYFVINPNSDFMACVSEHNKNENLVPFVEFFRGTPGAAASWAANDLQKNLAEDDLENGTVRLMIAVCLYYNMVQMFENDMKTH